MSPLPPFTVVIPARYASTRLPGKPLADIGGRPMVVRVAEKAAASGAARVFVATDHAEIAQAVTAAGFSARMTGIHHSTGTDRIAELASRENFADGDLIVNVQGDEPLIEPALIQDVVAALGGDRAAAAATAAHPIQDRASVFNPNVVKVVLDGQGYALYFSRAPIPYARDAFAGNGAGLPDGLPVYRHIGIYAYRAEFLRTFARLAPSPIERFEALEQLRALWHGYRMRVALTKHAPAAGVDTAQDLEEVRARIGRRAS